MAMLFRRLLDGGLFDHPRVAARADREQLGPDVVHARDGLLRSADLRRLHGDLGQHAPARRAGARQHRVDERWHADEQDQRAQDRVAQPAQLQSAALTAGDVYVSINQIGTSPVEAAARELAVRRKNMRHRMNRAHVPIL